MAIDRVTEYRPISPINRSPKERDPRRRTRRDRDDAKRDKDQDKEHLIDERV